MVSSARLCLIACVALSFIAIEPELFQVLLTDRADLTAEMVSRVAPPGTQGYPEFLESVRERTPPGSTIALVVQPMQWDIEGGYSFWYYRASYLLAGRKVLPIVWRDGSVLIENVRTAQYIAVFRRQFPLGDRALIWKSRDGFLLSRR